MYMVTLYSNRTAATHPTQHRVSRKQQAKTNTTRKKSSGGKIHEALRNVPVEQAVEVEAFAAKYSVSIATLRQAKRFDKTGLPGQVKVFKDKKTKVLMIRRFI